MPKVELHCHLDGSLRPETMLELARDAGVTLPRTDADALRAYMRVDDARHLDDYLTRFDVTVSVLQTVESLERAAYELVEDASRDGVRYIEVRNAPLLNTRGGLTLDDVMQATLRGLARGERDHGTMARFIVCSLRHWAPSISFDLARLAVRYMDRGVVAFDLAGGEAGHPAAEHAEAFLYARAHDLNVTCHAGEGSGAASIRDALIVCGAYRIGHGTRAGEDAALVRHLCDRQVPLELCPTSNVQTRVVSSYAEHPLRAYFEQGLAVTINTDNRLMSGVTLTDEFFHAMTDMQFTVAELATCVRTACDAAFLPLDERVQLRTDVDTALREYSFLHAE
jgi:adenosine deaminase